MKKLYSLVAVCSIAAASYAQVTTVLQEDFAAYAIGGNTASTGANAADGQDVYAATPPTNVATFPTGTKVYQAGGMAKLGTSSLAGSMSTGSLDLSTNGGNVRITFDVKGWNTVEGDVTVTLDNGTSVLTQNVSYAALMAGTPETKQVVFVGGGSATSTITFATTAKRAYIDNITIETVDGSVLAISDLTATKKVLVKNTNIQDEVTFGAKSNDVKVFNMLGQVVKTASVKENETLNVSDLKAGSYIVTGTVANEAVSQKVIKN